MPERVPLVVLGDRVLIEPDRPPERIGTLYVANPDGPDVSGRVVAMGPSARCKACQMAHPWPDGVAVGAHVVFSPRAGQEVTIEGQRYLLLHGTEVLAILEDEDG